MNLFEILSGKGKHSSEDIAREIVALELKMPEFQKEEEETHKVLLKVWPAKESGVITASEYKDKKAKYEEAKFNHEAAQSTLVELQSALRDKIQKETEKASQDLESQKEKFAIKKEKALQQLVDMAIELRIAWEAIAGKHVNGDFLTSYMGYTGENYTKINKRLEEKRTQSPYPDLYKEENQIRGEEITLREVNIEEKVNELLNKARNEQNLSKKD